MNVFVTGGAGFLGRGLLRRWRAGNLPPTWENLTIFSRDETKQDECQRRYPDARYILGDVRDTEHLQAAMTNHDLVIHAAAMKYIPHAELNAGECVSVNVDGTRSVMRAAKQARIARVVGISTDKACQPVNVYGATKMIMERLFADELILAPTRATTTFSCVRYGNVIGSTGSVIPLFRRQAEENGKVFITDLRMTRFWMSVDEAVDCILESIRSPGGTIFVPFARAMTLVDVARAATKEDIEVVEIGARPGEKLHEALVHFEESCRVDPAHEGGHLLLPVNAEKEGTPFTLMSHTPNHHMSITDMRRAIEDARTV